MGSIRDIKSIHKYPEETHGAEKYEKNKKMHKIRVTACTGKTNVNSETKNE